MKKLSLLTISILLSAVSVNSQDLKRTFNFIEIENGFNFSEFDFSGSDTTSSFISGDYSPQTHLGFRLVRNLSKSFQLSVVTSIDKYKIIGEPIDEFNTNLSYDLNYILNGLELSYMKDLSGAFTIGINAGASMNRLLSGFQNIGGSTYNILNTGFEKVTHGYNYGFIVIHKTSDNIGWFFRYNIQVSEDMFESDASLESYVIRTRGLSLGLRIKLTQ
tara:strand:- start:250 stop:903 length:654 start_codon:yes stop_codon:yes gene_type:complete